MKNFKRGGNDRVTRPFNADRGSKFGGRGGDRGGRGGFGGRSQMFSATCSECGDDCEVPFKPTGGRPVLCSKCFDKQGGGSDRPSRFGGERRERSDRPARFDRSERRFEDKKMFEAVCDQCGKSCQVPFRPSPGKPVYCDDCFGKDHREERRESGAGRKDSGDLSQEIKALHVKMDKILSILVPHIAEDKSSKKKEIVSEKVVEVKDKKVVQDKKKPADKKEKAPAKAKVAAKKPVTKKKK